MKRFFAEGKKGFFEPMNPLRDWLLKPAPLTAWRPLLKNFCANLSKSFRKLSNKFLFKQSNSRKSGEKMKKLFVLGLVLFVGMGLAFALGEDSAFGMDVRKAVMQMHAAQLGCRVDFLTTMLEHSEEYTGESYDEIKDALSSSMEDVYKAAEENNLEAFLEAVKKTKGYFREAVQTIHDARVEAIKNYNGTNRPEFIRQMKEDFNSAQKEFTECHVEATRKRISAEIEMNRYWINTWRKSAKNMKERGYDTTELDRILDRADENTEDMGKVNKREKDVDVEKLLEERRMRWEHHLYLWAKYHSERLNLLLDRIEERTDGYEEQVGEIREILDRASSIGDDEYYTSEEYREAREYLLDATKKISELVSQIQGLGRERGEG